mmetsp:Transcript_3665/g.5382  ORF Transcript_3665/g.5382 Transcript_3665/m.5382 type:complete len:590 (-) Transcript_3665:114-1883(-)
MADNTTNTNTETPHEANVVNQEQTTTETESEQADVSSTPGDNNDENGDATTTTNEEEEDLPDPLLAQPASYVREGDHVLLIFADGRQIFAHCVKSWKGKTAPVKINKRTYTTANLVGLPYGTVLELGRGGLVPLPEGEDVLPDPSAVLNPLEDDVDTDENTLSPAPPVNKKAPSIEQVNDNRNLVDNNTSQKIQADDVQTLRSAGMEGSAIVSAMIENSSTFQNKTDFSKAKYIVRKQMKYQPRCRMVRCTASSVCAGMYLKDPRKLMNLREDTLAQMLSYSNVSAGCQVLVVETCLGIVTGALAQRLGGYGKILSVYSGQQPSYSEMINKFNLSFPEHHSIKWVHSGEVFSDDNGRVTPPTTNEHGVKDLEKMEREMLKWPCHLQDHTRAYLGKMSTLRDQKEFLAKRCARFARKLTRHTPTEARDWLKRPCDSVIIAARYDPTATLLPLLPYLAPSCPFVVFCEFLEPLTECFRELQRQSLAINLRLSDTWMREYQVLPGRTHPSMTMSQNGGFLLTGIKLCPVTGKNELDEKLLKELRAQVGGRRGRKPKQRNGNGESGTKNGRGKKKKGGSSGAPNAKRTRVNGS